MRSLSFLIVSALLSAAGMSAQAPTLKVGDAAPSLDVEHWIKGEAVTDFQPGQAYIVEFWATWCPPCKDSMPHLSALQEELGDKIVIIGVSDETLDVAKGFLDKPEWAEKTHYTLCTDPDRSTHRAYMDAANQNGIPTSFLVNGEGKIAWIGHPAMMDRPLEKMLGVALAGKKGSGGPAEGAMVEIDFDGMMDMDLESTPAAQAWLDKADAALRQAPARWDYEMAITVMAGMSQDDMEKLLIRKRGTVVRGGEHGTRIEAVDIMDFPGMPEPMETKSTIVEKDGFLYLDSASPMPMSPSMRGRLPIEEAQALRDEFAGPMSSPGPAAMFDPNPIYADPASALAASAAMCALDVVEESETQVILRGKASPMLDMGSMMGMGDEGPEGLQAELILDATTGLPVRFLVGNPESPAFRIEFSDFAAIEDFDPTTIPLGAADAQWPDLGEIIREQMDMMFTMDEGDDFDEDPNEF